jgi:hypothetical protein
LKFSQINLKVDWLNQYNKDIREKVGPRLASSYKDTYEYMMRITEPFKYGNMLPQCNGSSAIPDNGAVSFKAGIAVFLAMALTCLNYLS